jgi:lipopolysaccharide exporter
MIQKIRNSEFIKNILVLFSGSLISQLIPFLALPILQKYFYTPADFGILALFISFCELFSKVASLKLELGIVLQRKTREAINLVYGALRVSWLVAFLALVLVSLFKNQLARQFGLSGLENYLFLLPVYIVVTSFNDIASYWFNRKKKFGTISFSKVAQTSSAEGIKLLAGWVNFSAIGLIVGRLSGFVISNVYYLRQFYRHDKNSLRLLSGKESNRLVSKNRKFIFFTTPSVFIGSLINLLYLNLFFLYFGQEIVGMIGVSMTYISAAFGVVSLSFSQVFYAKVSETQDTSLLLSMYKRFAKNLAVLAIVPVLVVYFFPVEWVVYLLGDEWANLLVIARIMVLWQAVWFVSASLSFIYIKLGRQKEMVVFDVLHLLLIIFSFYLAIWFKHDFFTALWGFTIGQIIFYLFAIYIAIFYIKKHRLSTVN